MSLCDGLSSGIWLYALLISAIEKIAPSIRVKIICIVHMGQQRFVSSIIVFIDEHLGQF